MPASTLDPVNAAIRSSLSKTATETNLDVQLAGATKKALLADIEFEVAGSYQTSVLDKLKTKYIVLKSPESQQTSITEKMGADETLTLAKHELYPLEAVQLGWSNSEWVVGAGMVNMGNTCYLNSTLQALFHVPALVNWLISDKQHMSRCEDSGGLCIICAMRKTLQDSQQRNTNSIRPFLIYNKLRMVCRNLIPGRQEDAHEFLRYLVEAMEKAYLRRFKNHSEFDSRTKETTPLNQILGGYLRSAVRCLECGHVSTTFQHFQDLLLDIRKAQTVEEALDGYFSREKLDDESYHCESCQKKVPATKQFSLERAPMVLCIQLKRFSVSNNKITKHVQFRSRLELTKFARHRTPVPLVYRFVALVTHMGPTVGCGHYTAVAQAPCGNYYQFDDSMVRPISHQAVFSTNAYIMLYELECPPFTQKTQNNCNSVSSAATSSAPTTSTSIAASCSPRSKAKVANSGDCAGTSSSSSILNTLTVHTTNKIQQSDRGNSSGKKLLSSTNNGVSGLSRGTNNSGNNNVGNTGINNNKLQVNGTARVVVYGPELPPDLDMLVTLATTMVTSTTTTSTTNVAVASASLAVNPEQNGAVSSSATRNGEDKKLIATNSIDQRHRHHYSVATSSSSSSTEKNDSTQQTHRKNLKHSHQAILPTLIGRNRTMIQQNGDASTSSTSSLIGVQPFKAATQFARNSEDAAVAVNNSSSPARSCSSSSVSSLSSNVGRGDSNSPKATTDSLKTATSRVATGTITKLLVPYDVDDDDEDEDEEEREEGKATPRNEIDAMDCENSNSDGSSSSSCCIFVDKGGGGCNAVDGNDDGKTIPRAITTTTTIMTTTCTNTTTALKPIIASETTLMLADDTPRVPTKATTTDWQVTSSIDRSEQIPSSEGHSWNKKRTFQKEEGGGGGSSTSNCSASASTVSELLKMSHVGYSAPVSSWNGTRAGLDKEVGEERREERKRTLCDNSDRGRVKHAKTNLSSVNNYGASNPGYNRLQEYHNAKNSWNQQNNNNGNASACASTSSSYGGGANTNRQFYNTSGKHRNKRNNFHRKNGGNGYHKNNYAFRQ
ncbi:Peptidase [Oryctes borbonicus]|uniref:Ubiquitin carboxyl-terminal hydrolase 36 n=1 Tax=Oryctes borbonicus TaxID=1629725 RepID=A0A0T6B8M0_9SCAR|nr:Peptidase [Oryctes borbonicus]